jgi:hypothetical protein
MIFASRNRRTVVEYLRKQAWAGLNEGHKPGQIHYISSCLIKHQPDDLHILFTRDAADIQPGMKACWHLAVYRQSPQGFEEVDYRVACSWCEEFFGRGELAAGRVKVAYLNKDLIKFSADGMHIISGKKFHFVRYVDNWDAERVLGDAVSDSLLWTPSPKPAPAIADSQVTQRFPSPDSTNPAKRLLH